MYCVQIETDAGTVQIPCDTLESARAEERKCVKVHRTDDEDDDRRIFVEGVFGVKVFVRCVKVDKRKDKDGNLREFYKECSGCGECQKREGSDRVTRFKNRYATHN